MMIFLILAPYGAFAALMLFASAAASLFVSAAICVGVIALDVVKGRSIKMLGAGSAILFAALGCYVTLVDTSLSSTAVKLTVDTGVLAISLMSLLIRRPFTLQYARQVVDAETAQLPGFQKANYVITWAWTAAATPRSILPNGIRGIIGQNSLYRVLRQTRYRIVAASSIRCRHSGFDASHRPGMTDSKSLVTSAFAL